MRTERVLKVWYDKKRDCYSTDAAFMLAKQTGFTPMFCAQVLKAWIEQNYPELFASRGHVEAI